MRIGTCPREHKCFWRDVCRHSSHRTHLCVVACGTLSHTTELSLRKMSASITAQPLRSMAEWSFPGSFGVYVFEVSDATRDRLLHHCFFGWRASCRLQPFEICASLSQRQQQARFVSARDKLGKPLVKCCRVGKDSFVQVAQPDDRSAPSKCGNILSSMLKQISRASCLSTAPCRDRPDCHEFCLELWGHHVRPRPEPDREPVCHGFAGGNPRDPVGADIFARLTRDLSGSRFPGNTVLKSSVEGSSSSGSAAPSSSSSSNNGNVDLQKRFPIYHACCKFQSRLSNPPGSRGTGSNAG